MVQVIPQQLLFLDGHNRCSGILYNSRFLEMHVGKELLKNSTRMLVSLAGTASIIFDISMFLGRDVTQRERHALRTALVKQP